MLHPSKKAFSLIELSVVILIIGILIAGVTQGSRLLGEMRFSSARSLTQSSNINSIPDLAIWFETTSEKSFLAERPDNGDAISQWNDINPMVLESRKINAIQADTNAQPIYRSNSINKLPALSFDGVNDNLAVADGFDGDGENATLFFVWKASDSGTSEMDLIEKWEGSGGYPYVLRVVGNYYFRAYDGAKNPGPASTTPRASGTPIILSARRVKGGVMNIWVNGVKQGGDVTDTTTANTANNGRLCICARLTANINYCKGDIAEIIIFNRALKTEERKSVENYLSKKWDISVS